MGAIALVLSASALASAQVEYGISANYPHDDGIGSDPSVVFSANFEESSLDEVFASWEYLQWPENWVLDSDHPPSSSGNQSLFATTTAALYQRLLPGYDQLYFRFYVKIDPGCTTIHHWPWLGGRNPSTEYPYPQAGERPVGDDRFSSGIEPIAGDFAWDFYTYWKDMGGSPDGYFWGNTFNRTNGGNNGSPYPTVKGEWVSVEMMIKMNSPVDSSNGEQAFWINGEKKSHLGPGFPNGNWVWDKWVPDPGGEPFAGYQWRTVPELNINYVWLEHFVDTEPSCQARFDDLVIATSYIGPIAEMAGMSSSTGSASGGGSQSGTGETTGSGSGSGTGSGTGGGATSGVGAGNGSGGGAISAADGSGSGIGSGSGGAPADSATPGGSSDGCAANGGHASGHAGLVGVLIALAATMRKRRSRFCRNVSKLA